jgi:ribosomal protein S18 acetylase RimI-like enzyme
MEMKRSYSSGSAPPGACAMRPARRSDAKAIAALHASSWQLAYRGILSDAYLDRDVLVDREAVWEERLRQPPPRQHVVVAEDGGLLLGFACVYLDENPAWGSLLDNIHVDRKAQRRGLGSELLRQVADVCVSSAPGSGLYLSVLENNTTAQQFYYAHGAENVGTETWDAPDGNHLLCFRLAWRLSRLPVARLVSGDAKN